jgi:hypothetical protein
VRRKNSRLSETSQVSFGPAGDSFYLYRGYLL